VQHAVAREVHAVGDLFIDGTLVDIKVNKNVELGRDIFNHLPGYFCLSCIGGVDGCRGKVTCVAINGLLARFDPKSLSTGKSPHWFPCLRQGIPNG
jgi:hypothetical protein